MLNSAMNRVTRPALVAIVGLALLLPCTVAAEVVLRPHDPELGDRPLDGKPILNRLTKLDQPTSLLILPFYDVDSASATGTTTLFAVRNTTAMQLGVLFAYANSLGDIERQDIDSLDPRATRSVNLRDVAGIPDQGFGVILADTDISTTALAGDFFQVDIGGAFATGERLVSVQDICDEHEIRFLDFGSGTVLRLFINSPQGDDPDLDPPTFTVDVLDEDGALFAGTDVFTDQVVLELTAADFTELAFGTLIFNFTNSSGGWVYAEYSADGLFSVGLNSTCTVPSS